MVNHNQVIQEEAPAKINLTLEILGLREDGYHEIRSLMQSLALSDRLELRLVEEDELVLTCSDGSLSCGEDNLVMKAARLLKKTYQVQQGSAMHLEKVIPIEAGMAGGSSDAAATLRGLNRLWGLNLPMERLEEIGAQLGSDIPFCVHGGTALVTGRGERVRKVRGPKEESVLIVKPDFGASTKRVYGAWDVKHPPVDLVDRSAQLLESLKGGGGYKAYLHNDLEAITIGLLPEVGLVLERMRKATPYALMSGSGPTCFCMGDNAIINELYDEFSKEYRSVFMTTLQSPLE